MRPYRFLAALLLAACARQATVAPNAPKGWTNLTTLSAWRVYKSTDTPKGWAEENGMLVKRGDGGDDIVSREQYGNFELTLDWKLSSGGNSGVLYRGTEEYDHIYWSAPEYQLLDDAKHPDGKNPLTSAGAAYGLYPAPRGVVKPADEWNSTRIVANGNHVEHWLNGQKTADYTLMSPDWEAKVAASKFKSWPHYGRSPKGYLSIQGDHNGTLMVRNIRIRVLP